MKLVYSHKTFLCWLPRGCANQRGSFVKLLRLLSNQWRNRHIGGWVKMKRYHQQAADQWRRYTRMRQVSPRSGLMPWLSPWLKLRESSFELVKFESSPELKTEASNIRTLFNILPIVQTTIGRYQRTNRLIPIIGKTADNRPIPIIGWLSVHHYLPVKCSTVTDTQIALRVLQVSRWRGWVLG